MSGVVPTNPTIGQSIKEVVFADSHPVIPDLAELLQNAPLHSPRNVRHLFVQANYSTLALPQSIRVYCENEKCLNVGRHIKSESSASLNIATQERGQSYVFAEYRCIDCQESRKVFGLKAEKKGEVFHGTCTKIYQEPAFGNPIPNRLFQIIGEENRKHFLQARAAIARSLGIGAYAYYRRIVENTKFALISSVLEIAVKTNAPAAQVELLKQAQKETQFSKAIEHLRDVSAIPPILLIDGQNPLAWLHDALSQGIHNLSDSECLQRAREAEIVLCEVADRMQIALTERNTVKEAFSSMMNRKASSSPKGDT